MNNLSFLSLVCFAVALSFHVSRVVTRMLAQRNSSQKYPLSLVLEENFMPALFIVSLLISSCGVGNRLEFSTLMQVTGLLLGCAGICFCVWARFTQSANWKLYSQIPDESHQLCTTGPYAWSRHPYYFGLIVHCAGFTLASANIFVGVVAVVWSIGCVLVAQKEERDLEQHFGLVWKKYKKKTHFLFGKI